MALTFVEYYAGVAGFRLALEGAGLKCVWANDNDKYACQVYRYHYNDGTLWEGDIQEVNFEQIPAGDILCAGFPCQAFSLEGHRGGFEDTRGTLFYNLATYIWHKKPKYLFLENVKGLLGHARGYTFYRILQILDVMGYNLQWQVLNSADFNLPHRRERVFIIGHIRGTPRPKIFPIQALGGEGETQGRRSPGSSDRIISTCLTRTYYKGPDNHRGRTIIKQGNTSRMLTPIECERLQGFPDNWTAKGLTTDGQTVDIVKQHRYECMGNAVSVPVLNAILDKWREA